MGGQTKKTNASGVAVFKSLGSSKYLYKAEKDGVERFGEVSVSTSATSVDIENF